MPIVKTLVYNVLRGLRRFLARLVLSGAIGSCPLLKKRSVPESNNRNNHEKFNKDIIRDPSSRSSRMCHL